MELNSDFSKRVLIHAGRMPWVPSPAQGVERRMLDRIGDEVARATSIVRYAPGSRFASHTHGGGEEFLVLDGVFQDEHGDFPAGTYIRNPPTSRHTPGSEPGCTIFVKLWQFDPGDRTHVRLDTSQLLLVPASGRPGVTLQPLFRNSREEVRLENWAPGTTSAFEVSGGIELLVLEGSLVEGGDVLEPQSWLRLPPGMPLRATAGANGCKLWIKCGHLSHVAQLPR